VLGIVLPVEKAKALCLKGFWRKMLGLADLSAISFVLNSAYG
jgi:hypothetical protein